MPIILSFLFLIVFLVLFFNIKYKELRWDWNKINLNNISFPKSFIWGTATASHQVEGNCTNNWSEFEKGFKKNIKGHVYDIDRLDAYSSLEIVNRIIDISQKKMQI